MIYTSYKKIDEVGRIVISKDIRKRLDLGINELLKIDVEDNKIVILAMTAVKKFSNTHLATRLIDEVDEGYEFGEIPPINKIIDKADFITIRAGKIQDQIKGGKGKGIKRDNIITNIIRSYTKSEW